MYFSNLNTPIDLIGSKIEMNANGIPKKTQAVLFSTFAQVKVQTFDQATAAMGNGVPTDTITFIIRYDQPQKIKNDMQIKYDGEIYEIEQQLPNKDTGVNQIICKKVG